MTLKLNGSSSGSVSIDAPASTTGGADVTLTLPVNDGDADQYLKTNGSGALSFSSVPLTTYATAVTANSTEHEFTGIPSTATKITIMWSGVTTNGTDDIQVKLGHSGGYYSTGYQSVGSHQIATATSESGSTSSFMIVANDNACVIHAVMEIYKVNDSATSAEWVEHHGGSDRNEYSKSGGGGLTGVTHTIDRVKVLLSGSNTYDGGKINVRWS
tara:strand:- start:46 stop:687 length:642 start_codon:yes stop_codon:yes gene_type:complete